MSAWLFLLLGLAQLPAGDGLAGTASAPAIVCLKYSTFQLSAGERVSGGMLGLEGMVLQVDGPSGMYSIAESEIRRPPRSSRLVETRSDARIRLGPKSTYWLYGRPSFSPDEDHLVVNLSSLARTKARDILARLTIVDPAKAKCDHRYLYGWEYMFPGSIEKP